MSAKEEYTQIIKDVYSINSFVKLCGMELVDVECGKVTLAMPIDAAKHTNLYEVPTAVHWQHLQILRWGWQAQV